MQQLRTVEQIRRQLKAEIKRKVKEVPQETHQQVMDIMRAGNSIGETCEALNLDQDVVLEIISQNISNYKYLQNLEAKQKMCLQNLPLKVREAIIDTLLRALQNMVVDGVRCNFSLKPEMDVKMLSLGVIEVELRELGDVYLFTQPVQDALMDIIDDAIGS